MPILHRVPVKWTFHNNASKFDTYEVQVELTKEQASRLVEESKEVDPKGKGIKIKKEEDGTLSYRFRRRAKTSEGEDIPKPKAVDKDGKTPFTKNIGNGSVCNVQYSFVKYDHPKFGVGVTNDFKGIQVLQHVAYGEMDGEGFENEEDSDGESFGDETASKTTKAKPSKSKDDFDDDDF